MCMMNLFSFVNYYSPHQLCNLYTYDVRRLKISSSIHECYDEPSLDSSMSFVTRFTYTHTHIILYTGYNNKRPLLMSH
ncbi:hypothetical protein DAPPUDRAFT_305890 [Daphnia pulex]|uniref:Uncharacterized protein n=1 Tax=Daphnia pulex TaxID=6669 RepID=E9GTU5_DAPPU|nr:hypothetical protein DAPPUDRAFT_305890 [Daphnia pulex]|eukprot:EFX77135.1 hypothetical protein DAPPUDRAFT_305890 [Daphnia pulex]